MLTPERHERILQKLREYKTITVQELTVQLNCSESTIRRDLSALDAEGLLKKIHGGATLLVKKACGKNIPSKPNILFTRMRKGALPKWPL